MQLKRTEDFLTSGALTVDIFALSPASAPLKAKTGKGVAAGQPELSTTFAVGEEATALREFRTKTQARCRP
jgi:hypothetical protein